jgi:hypothetical protein
MGFQVCLEYIPHVPLGEKFPKGSGNAYNTRRKLVITWTSWEDSVSRLGASMNKNKSTRGIAGFHVLTHWERIRKHGHLNIKVMNIWGWFPLQLLCVSCSQTPCSQWTIKRESQLLALVKKMSGIAFGACVESICRFCRKNSRFGFLKEIKKFSAICFT